MTGPFARDANRIAHGRRLERADVIGQLRQSIAGPRAIAERSGEVGVDEGVDIALYIARLEALISTIESGCHEGLGA